MKIEPKIAAASAELTAIRRDIHAHPELGFEEERTSKIVATKLKEWGCEVTTGIGKTGVVGTIRVGKNPRAIGLRADMDALPMDEHNTFDHRSRHQGRMHACGHDGHTTMLLGAARYLAETRNFDGTAYLIFQPAEEGGGGGPVMAATDELKISVRGTGGHGAFPHLSVDPVVAAAHIITALQSIVSRNVEPVDALVVSICSMATSQIGAFNVIPEAVQLIGTVRTFRPQTRDLAEKRVREVATKVAEAFG